MRQFHLPFRHSLALTRYNLALITRSRLIVMLLGFGAASICVSMVLTYLTPGTERRVFFDVAYLGLEFMAIMAPILGSTVLQILEFEQQTIWLVLVRPPSRSAYLWGRFWGLSLSSLFVIAAMGVTLAVLAAAFGALPEPFMVSVVVAAMLDVFVISALSCLVAFVTTSYLTGMIVMVGVVTLGYLSGVIPALAAKTGMVLVKVLLWTIYWALPHLSDLAVRDFAAPAEAWYLVLLCGYTGVYVSVVLIVAAVVFLRREM